MSRQWSATRDIPWDKLEPLPEDQERALCQFVSFLHTVEFVPGDTLPYYMARVDPSFPEVRLFMSSQCADEARHMEVFGKRMYANGGGPGIEPGAEAILQFDPRKSVLPPEIAKVVATVNPTWDFLAYSYYVQMIGEAVVLDFFRFGEFLGRNPCDKEMFRRIMQDEARHVSFGTMRIKYYLDNAPRQERKDAAEMLHFLASACGSQRNRFWPAASTQRDRAVCADGGRQPRQSRQGMGRGARVLVHRGGGIHQPLRAGGNSAARPLHAARGSALLKAPLPQE